MGRAGQWPLAPSSAVAVCGPSQAPPDAPTQVGMGTEPCRAGVQGGPSPPPQLPRPGAHVLGVLICKLLGLGAGTGSTESCLSCHPELIQIKKSPTTQNSEKSLFPNKIHGNASNTSARPFVFLSGELYKIFVTKKISPPSIKST